MPKFKLTPEEKALEDAFGRGEFRSVQNIKQEISKARKAAAATLKKDKRINIRISSRDLDMIQRRAVEEGLPYQTFIASILHKYASGTIPIIRTQPPEKA